MDCASTAAPEDTKEETARHVGAVEWNDSSEREQWSKYV